MYRNHFHLKGRKDELGDVSPQWQISLVASSYIRDSVWIPPPPTSTSPVSTALIQILSLEVKKKKLCKTAECIFEIKQCSVERTWSLDAFVAHLFFFSLSFAGIHSFLSGIWRHILVIQRHEGICLHNKMHVQFSLGKCSQDCPTKGKSCYCLMGKLNIKIVTDALKALN